MSVCASSLVSKMEERKFQLDSCIGYDKIWHCDRIYFFSRESFSDVLSREAMQITYVRASVCSTKTQKSHDHVHDNQDRNYLPNP